jgi:hypothetical protein
MAMTTAALTEIELLPFVWTAAMRAILNRLQKSHVARMTIPCRVPAKGTSATAGSAALWSSGRELISGSPQSDDREVDRKELPPLEGC